MAAGVLLLVAVAAVSPVRPAAAQTLSEYDFNTPGDLAAYFNGTGSGVADVTQSSGGIGGTTALRVPLSSVDAIFSSKEGYSIGPVGSTYTFSTYLKSEGNSGYSGVGFAVDSPATASNNSVFRPAVALGVSVHGGGFVFHNGAEDYFGNWGSAEWNDPEVTAVTVAPAGCPDLINSTDATCGSPDQWYRVVFRIERATATTFDLRVEVWPSDEDGTLRYGSASAIFDVNGVESDSIREAPQVFAYFNFSGERVTAFDDYRVELGGGATVIAAGSPVVLTETVAASGAVITVEGRVSFEGDSAVTERGFVYGTGASPTIADTKVAIGSGTGAFSGAATLPSTGTYHVRAFATNATGTSYGASLQVVIGSGGGGGGSSAAPAGDPLADVVGPLVDAATTLTGADALLMRGGQILPTTSTFVGGTGGGALIVEAPDLRVTMTTSAGVARSSGVTVTPDGEIVCEICARLAAGSVVEAWIYSAPRLAAAVRVDIDIEDGVCPFLRIPIGGPLDGAGAIPPGAHTLQLRMYTADGLEVLAIPITVGGTGAAASGPAVPTRVNTGGGPVPVVPMPLGVTVALAAVLLLVIEQQRTVAFITGMTDRRRTRSRHAPGRRLTGFDTLQARLQAVREAQRDS